MGFLSGRRRKRQKPDFAPPVEFVASVETAVLRGEVRWSQPFQWGLLLAMDHAGDIEVPEDVGPAIVATNTVIAVPVLHAQDVDIDDLPDDAEVPQAEVQVIVVDAPLVGQTDFDGVLDCHSGQVEIGDAEAHHVLTVPSGRLRVQVRLEPKEHADLVLLAVTAAA